MSSRFIHLLVVSWLMALGILGSSHQALAQALEATPIAALPAPRLIFSEDEMALANAVAGNPGLADFYGSNGLKPVFEGQAGAQRRLALIHALGTAPQHGLPPSRYGATRLQELHHGGADTASAELAFAQAFMRWSHDVTGGMLEPGEVDSGIKRSVNRRSPGAMMRDFVSAADPEQWLSGLPSQDPRYLALQDALSSLSRLAAPPGTPEVPVATWRAGDQGEGVTALRTRLAALGFAAEPLGAGDVFDAPLTAAVQAFQRAAGLSADGVAGRRTITRLNRGVGPEAQDILVALERMRWMTGHDPQDRQIWVNLPSYTAVVMDGGQPVFSTKVVIGKDEATQETPEFTESMKFVVVNPRWNVPRSITVKEYLPRLKSNRNAVGHIDVVDRAGNVIPRDRIDFGKYSAGNFPYQMRQKPSGDNALGVVKFLFPNPWNIYLHDTPTKHLFNQSRRAYSHGCIRVARPVDLAHELLKGQVANPEATFSRALASGRENYLTLAKPMPVHLVYFTAFPDQDGKIRRYPDIYGRDAAVYAALVKAGRTSGLDSADQGH